MKNSIRTGLLVTLALSLTGTRFFSEAPLWCDEVLQFAFGAYTSTAEAWHWVRATTPGVNMGQTGAYIMLDYWSLQAFGASRLAMRWPSLLAGILLVIAVVRLLALWGIPWRWRLFAVLGIYGQSCMTDLIPNARYYLPLIAGSMAAGAFYFTPVSARGGWTVALGVTGMLMGGLFHPYFPLYAAGLCLLAFAWHVDAGRARARWSVLWRHSAPPVWALGAVCWYGIGKLTWMQGQPKWTENVWAGTGTGWTAVATFLRTHIEFLPGVSVWLAAPILVAGVAIVVRQLRRRVALRASAQVDARAALLWVGFALAASLLLAGVSWRKSYPIFLRQWSVSATMLPLGVAWLLAVITRSWRPRAAWLAAAVSLLLVAGGTGSSAIRWWRVAPAPPPSRPRLISIRPADINGWIELANQNVTVGGPVYPVFRTFYRF